MEFKYDSAYAKVLFLILAIGIPLVFGIAIYFDQQQLREYPYVTTKDSFQSPIAGVKKQRGVALVILESGRKIRFSWATNNAYRDFNDLVQTIEPGDVVTKHEYSDTLFVSHLGKKYFYRIERHIN